MEIELEIQKLVDEIRAQGFESICFWMPSYSVVGANVSFFNLSLYFKRKTTLKVFYVTYEDGYLAKQLTDAGITVVPYYDESSTFSFLEKCAIVTSSTRPIMLKKMRPDNKLLFWHNETAPCAWESVFLQNETQNYFQLCREKHAMVFHDWSSWDALSQDAGFEFEKMYLPLCIEPRQTAAKDGLVCADEMHLAWLGRLVPDKMYSLLYLVDNFAQYVTSRRKVLHIVGDGRSRQEIEAYCKQFSREISFDFKGTMTGDRLDEFLAENADVLFAMGTSLLEGAALKIPTAVVMLDTAQIRSNEFFWFFDSKEYCCGVLTSQAKRFGATYSHFRDMMDDVFEYGMKEEYGEKSFRYYMENHSDIQHTVYLLLHALKHSALTMADLKACIKYVPYNHIKVVRRKFLGRKLSDQVIFEAGGED